MSWSLVSFIGFIVLNALLAWGVGILLWWWGRHRAKGVHLVVAAMAVTSFAFGALWFNVVHILVTEPPPPNVPVGGNPPIVRVVFAGFVGVLLLTVATACVYFADRVRHALAGRLGGTEQPAPRDPR